MGELTTTSGKQYLDKDFSTELNFKLWTTKGARFTASKRLKQIGKLSSYSIGFLTAYIIIINMISVFDIVSENYLTPQALAFITTALSILVLVFSQLENANEYRFRAERFHDCALEIGELYNDLRYFKTNFDDDELINKEAKNISAKYSSLLREYENHDSIDFEYFKTTKVEYFKLSTMSVYATRFKYYLKVKFLYHTLIIFPIILFIVGAVVVN